MKLAILAVGHKPPDWAASACAEYIKRMPRELALWLVDVKPEPRGTKNRSQLLAAERVRLQAAAQGYSRVVVLDERGADLSTRQFAERLEDWMRVGGDTAFVIGGADGIDDDFKARAAEIIRLSSLTLPHALARLILCEQIYRAVSILRRHPYHREG